MNQKAKDAVLITFIVILALFSIGIAVTMWPVITG